MSCRGFLCHAAAMVTALLVTRATAAPASLPGEMLPTAAGQARDGGRASVSQRRADQFLRQGRVADAAREYGQAARADRDDPTLRLASGVTLSALGRPRDAVVQFRAAMRLAEDDVVAALLYEGALLEIGQTNEAQLIRLEIARRFPPADPHGTGLDASGSITRLRAALTRFPNSPLLHLLLGDAYQVAERWVQAREAYERASWLAPRWAKPHVNRGVLLLTLDQPVEAIRAFETALRLEPANGQTRLLLADGQMKRGDTDAALRALQDIAGPPEVRADAKTRIGQIHLSNGNPLAALPHFNAAQRLAPRSVAPLAGRAEAEVRSGNFAAGVEAYRSALKLASAGGLLSTRPVLYRGLTEAQLSARDPDGALRTLTRALADEPRHEPLWRRLMAAAYFARHENGLAEAALRRALESDTERYPIDILNAIAGRNLLAKVSAFYQAELAVPQSPRRPVALVALAHLAQYSGDIGHEVDFRQRAVEARPTPMNWFLLADACRRSGPARATYARRAYAEALKNAAALPEGAADEARQYLRVRPSMP